MVKKLVFAVAVLALSTAAVADEFVKGGFEASGSVNAGVGWQHWSKNYPTVVTQQPVSSGGNNAASAGSTFGPIGGLNVDGVNNASGKQDEWAFFVQSVELDFMKNFGENINSRVDLDFGSAATASVFGVGTVAVEQAYVTTGLGAGEFLLGRFNAPMGIESVDVGQNDTFSRSNIFRALRPQNLTGAKFYYAITDSVDWHLYVVNNLRDNTAANTGKQNMPGFGTRLGFSWGDEAQPNTVGINAAAGEEANTTAAKKRGEWSYLGDLDLSWWATEAFNLGLEGLFRIDNAAKKVKDDRYFGGLANVTWVPSEVWDGTLRYAWTLEQAKAGAGSTLGSLNGLAAARGLQAHEISLAGQYYITDGAKVQAEGRFDMLKPDKGTTSAGGTGKTYYVYGAAMNFSYDF